jgi:two-component system nitrate/nitrite response regulator NarL
VVEPVVVLPGTRSPVSTHTTTSLMVCVDEQRAPEVEAAGQSLGVTPQCLSSAAEVRAYADTHAPPDLCAIITPLGDGPVLPLIRILRSRGWPSVAVLSSRADARAVHSALLNGVRAVVVRSSNESVSPAPTRPHGKVPLSDREVEVLRMVADGRSNRDVGEQLGLSGLTVKSHLARIARKLGSGDRAHLVATAIRNGYIR